MFAGRYQELLALEKGLFQTKHGNPTHFLIDGERGIGKSSLLLNLAWTSTGEVSALEESQRFNFITVSVCLDSNHTYGDIVRSIASELKRQISTRDQLKELAKATWEFVKKLEVGGVKYRDQDAKALKDTELVEDLAFAIAESLRNLGSDVDGVLILIDEADKPPASANLGAFVKLLTERLKLRGCDRVCIGLAGLTAVRGKLLKSHESSLRLFKVFALQPLSSEDCSVAIRRGLDAAKEKNGFDVTIVPEAEANIAFITEGYPHFIQQFAFCAFDADRDNNIDDDDVLKGSYGDNGALKQLGLKYFQKQYFDQINSDEYRQVLRVMAKHFDGWVTKSEIRKDTKHIKASTLDNALSALKAKGIVLPKTGTKGTYKLPSSSFAVWLRACTQAQELITSSTG
ncbi:MAG: ATP-binding protein [Acidobacteriaceae bacterium]